MKCKRCGGTIDRKVVLGRLADHCTWCLAIRTAGEKVARETREGAEA
jgi:hypothetical protein